jgi:hypothetical protein
MHIKEKIVGVWTLLNMAEDGPTAGFCEYGTELRLPFLTTSVDLSCYGETRSVHFDPIFPVTFL